MAPNPTLADRLGAALLPPDEEETPGTPGPSTADRILDAAMRRFAEVGIRSTTMSSIAAEAGLSREWLYRHFSNKDAVLTAVVHRELRRFIDGLATGVEWTDDVADMLTEAFVYCVEFFRDRPAVDGLLDHDIAVSPEDIRSRAGAVVALAVRTCADYLVDLGGFDATRATVVSETLVRLVGSTLLAPSAVLDLHDHRALRDYAERVVPAIVDGC